MPDPSKRDWLVNLVEQLCDTDQPDLIDAADVVLRGLLNGAVALRYIRMHPQFAAENIEAFLKGSVRPDEKKTQ